MTNARSCITTALKHEDIISNLSPLFASIPELCTQVAPTHSDEPIDYTLSGMSAVKLGPTSLKLPVDTTTVVNPHPACPVASGFTADPDTSFLVDST